MSDIFISYAREDLDRARRLASALESRGWSVWWDRRIVAGQTFDQTIERELESARSVVVLWSKDSIESEWTKNEATVAAERNVLVPALLDDVRIPLEFRRKQTANLIDWDGDASHEGFQALCEGIAGRIGAPSATMPTHVLPPPPPRRRWPIASGWRTWTAAAAVAVAATTAGALWWTGGGADQPGAAAPRDATTKPAAATTAARWTGRCDADHWHRTAAGCERHRQSGADHAGRRPEAHPGKERGLLFPAVFAGRRRENHSGHASVWRWRQEPAERLVDPRRAWRRPSSRRGALQRVRRRSSQDGGRLAEATGASGPEIAEYGCSPRTSGLPCLRRRRLRSSRCSAASCRGRCHPPGMRLAVSTEGGCVLHDASDAGQLSSHRRFTRVPRVAAIILGAVTLLDADGGNEQGVVRFSETDITDRQVGEFSVKTDEPRILRIHNRSGTVSYALKIAKIE